MKVIPTLDRVVIQRDKQETKTEGGIILTKDAQKESNYGTIIDVGDGAFLPDGTRRPVRLNAGQRVLFTDYHTTGCSDGLVIADEEDVLAVIED